MECTDFEGQGLWCHIHWWTWLLGFQVKVPERGVLRKYVLATHHSERRVSKASKWSTLMTKSAADMEQAASVHPKVVSVRDCMERDCRALADKLEAVTMSGSAGEGAGISACVKRGCHGAGDAIV